MVPKSLIFVLTIIHQDFARGAPILVNFILSKDGGTVLNDVPEYTKYCKGIEINTEYIIECGSICMTPTYAVWGLSMITDSDGPCGWFSFDEMQGKCHVCFPSSNLPTLLNFDSSNSSKIFMSVTCE